MVAFERTLGDRVLQGPRLHWGRLGSLPRFRGPAQSSASRADITTHGFTGHEMLDAAGFADALAQGAMFEQALLSGMMSGASGAAFSDIGSHLATHFGHGFAAGLSAGGFALKVGLHGTVGGIAGALQGGHFGHGFAAAGLTALGSGFNNSRFVGGPGFSPARVAIAAAIGGTASRIAGGKFANGAVTGAFATIVGSASATASDEVPVSAGKDVNHTDFSDKPAPQGNVLTTPEMDAAATDLASTMKVGWNEVALTVTSDGVIHRKKAATANRPV